MKFARCRWYIDEVFVKNRRFGFAPRNALTAPECPCGKSRENHGVLVARRHQFRRSCS